MFVLASLALTLFNPFAPLPADEPLSAADREAIRAIIQAQLDAFQADDADAAFSYATPSIQARFGTASNFMAMVITGYDAVYRPKAVFFKEAANRHGLTVQRVLFIDRQDRSVLAIYPMQRQSDGSWRIDGCYLTKSDSMAL